MKYLWIISLSFVLFNGSASSDENPKNNRASAATALEKSTSTGFLDAQDADNYISSQVRVALRENKAFSEPHIAISVKEGVVTLSGPVIDERAKAALAQRAASVEGVKSVKNNLTVEAPKK